MIVFSKTWWILEKKWLKLCQFLRAIIFHHFCHVSLTFGHTRSKLTDGVFIFCCVDLDASYFCFMSLSTIGFGDMVPGSYPRYDLVDSRNITVWFCSCYIMSGMALTAMCFNILHDEIVHRLAHQTEKNEPVKPSTSVDELSNDPFALTSWQFPTSNACHRNVTEESLCGEPPSSIFAHDNEINILKDSYNQVDVTRDCKPIIKLEDHIVGPISAVYTLPELDEEAEDNTEM